MSPAAKEQSVSPAAKEQSASPTSKEHSASPAAKEQSASLLAMQEQQDAEDLQLFANVAKRMRRTRSYETLQRIMSQFELPVLPPTPNRTHIIKYISGRR